MSPAEIAAGVSSIVNIACTDTRWPQPADDRFLCGLGHTRAALTFRVTTRIRPAVLSAAGTGHVPPTPVAPVTPATRADQIPKSSSSDSTFAGLCFISPFAAASSLLHFRSFAAVTAAKNRRTAGTDV